MRQNPKCYGCGFFKECEENREIMKKCTNNDYVLFCTEQEKELCDIMCGEPEDD